MSAASHRGSSSARRCPCTTTQCWLTPLSTERRKNSRTGTSSAQNRWLLPSIRGGPSSDRPSRATHLRRSPSHTEFTRVTGPARYLKKLTAPAKRSEFSYSTSLTTSTGCAGSALTASW